MKILTPPPTGFQSKFGFAANLFGNTPSAEVFVEYPVQKAEICELSPDDYGKKLTRELKSIKKPVIISAGFSSEIFAEGGFKSGLFESLLKTCTRNGFPIALTTSSTEILDYLPLLQRAASVYCAVAVKIPSADDSVLQLMQPGYPLFAQRMDMIRQLSSAGIKTGAWIYPVLPFINDNADSFTTILKSAAESGATFALYHKKLTLSAESRANLFNNINIRYPQLAPKYEELFADKNETFGPNFMAISNAFSRTAPRSGLKTEWPDYKPPQLSLF